MACAALLANDQGGARHGASHQRRRSRSAGIKGASAGGIG
jgi:hypothetical protein